VFQFGSPQVGAVEVGPLQLGAGSLTQEQLDEACGDEKTKLPPGLSIKPCPDDSK